MVQTTRRIPRRILRAPNAVIVLVVFAAAAPLLVALTLCAMPCCHAPAAGFNAAGLPCSGGQCAISDSPSGTQSTFVVVPPKNDSSKRIAAVVAIAAELASAPVIRPASTPVSARGSLAADTSLNLLNSVFRI